MTTSAGKPARRRSRTSIANARPSEVKRSRPRRVAETKKEKPRLVAARFSSDLSPSRDEKRRESRSLAGVIWLGVMAFMLLSLGLLAIQSIAFMSGNKKDSVVPGVIGIPYEDAALSVEQAKLKLTIRSESYADKIEANRIMEQSPTGGARVKEGREVMVDVSLGSRNLTTPNVIGRLKDEALATLDKMGVTYNLTNQYSDVAPDGTIINQRPAPGAPIALGEAVDLVIASRPLSTMVEMPHLEGMLYDEAMKIINDSKLALREVRRVYQTGASDVRVFTQFPLAGTRIREGGEIILTLACPTSYETQGQRSTRVAVTVPKSAGTVRVRIVVQDRYQTQEVYSADQTGPTTIEQLITSYGRTTVKIYFNNNIIREESY